VSEPIRIAVVGLGYWGPNLVRNLVDLDGCELVAICDQDRERLALIGRRYPSTRQVRDVAELIDDPEVDAMVVATPVSTHYEIGIAALAAGKHLFVEKPLAASEREAADLVSLAKQRGKCLMPGHTFLYSPPVVAVRELIESGTLGELQFISSSRVNLGLHQSDVSVVWDLGPHDFSILRYWLAETPTHASATARACVGTVPDVAFVSLEFASGVIAHVELSWLAPSKLRRTTVVGSQKMVLYDDTSSEPLRIFDSGVQLPEPETFGEYRLTYRTGDIVSPRVDAIEPLYLELSDFCQSIRTGAEPRSSARVGLEVVRMIEAVDTSLSRDGTRVEVGSHPDLSGAGLLRSA
jgi:predicted dehydrogenase